MPQPTTSLATLRPDLAGSLEEFDLAMDRNGFIGLRVLPVIEVAKKSGTFGRIPLEQLLQERDTLRAPGSGYSRGNFKFTPDSYICEEHGAEEPVDDTEAEMYREYFDAELVATERARDVVLRNHELRVASLVFNATTFTSQTTNVTNEWDDYGNATPIDNIETAVRAIWNRTGLWPNALIINRIVFRNLRNCEQVIDRIASQGAGSAIKASDITADMLARVFDLQQVLVAGSPYNSANEGAAATIAPIWSSEYAMVARLAGGNDIREPGLGRTFHWGADGSRIGTTIESYRDETIRGDVIRARHDVDEKLIYPEAAQLLDNVTTT
ncbi:MAG TPA: hypothetical protein PK847_11930 [Candidatus Sumerlaeota bacterium]|nr:hypothetical protein [Candidatus Sumerlaeota bacterium]HOR28370.1 hypothetical protein [Candidatus Sumerlaeota bacterium]